MNSPTQRTLKLLRAKNLTCQVTERWCSFSRRRIDLFGVIDIVACSPAEKIIGIQCTSGVNHSHRVEKAKAEPRLKAWLSGGGRFWVVSWRKGGPRGKRKTWQNRTEELLFVNNEFLIRPIPPEPYTEIELSSIQDKFSTTPPS